MRGKWNFNIDLYQNLKNRFAWLVTTHLQHFHDTLACRDIPIEKYFFREICLFIHRSFILINKQAMTLISYSVLIKTYGVKYYNKIEHTWLDRNVPWIILVSETSQQINNTSTDSRFTWAIGNNTSTVVEPACFWLSGLFV